MSAWQAPGTPPCSRYARRADMPRSSLPAVQAFSPPCTRMRVVSTWECSHYKYDCVPGSRASGGRYFLTQHFEGSHSTGVKPHLPANFVPLHLPAPQISLNLQLMHTVCASHPNSPPSSSPIARPRTRPSSRASSASASSTEVTISNRSPSSSEATLRGDMLRPGPPPTLPASLSLAIVVCLSVCP